MFSCYLGCCNICTINSEIFARVLILRNLAYAKFHENEISRDMARLLCHLLIYVNHALVVNFERRKYVF